MRRPGFEVEFDRLRWRLRLALGALVLVTLVGVFGYVLIGGTEGGVVDAIYMTVITLTTVGFGEIIDMTNNPAGRIFTVLLLLVGMGIVAYTVPMVAAFFIEGQLHHIFARRRMQKAIEGQRGHFIVCGDVPAAWFLAEELVRTRRPVVLVVPAGPDVLDDAPTALDDVPRIEGDSSDDDVLESAGAERAGGIVFCMRENKDNVLGVLTAPTPW